MTKKQKTLIKQATPYQYGTPLVAIYVIPSGRAYRDPFCKKGGDQWQHMILIGVDSTTYDLYLIEQDDDNDIDILRTFDASQISGIDIPLQYDTVRLLFDRPVVFDRSGACMIPKEIDSATGNVKQPFENLCSAGGKK